MSEEKSTEGAPSLEAAIASAMEAGKVMTKTQLKIELRMKPKPGSLALTWWLGDERSIPGIELCCASLEGMAEMRIAASDEFGLLMRRPIEPVRPVRFDAMSISTMLVFEGARIRLSIVHEACFQAHAEPANGSKLPVMDTTRLITRLLLAATDTPMNAEEALQRMADLQALAARRGGIPRSAWRGARRAHGRSVFDAHRRAVAEWVAVEW